eukprot:comp12147_c0_seq1/m.6897 comp12147_c0_seq1/g.6897  ORF comp12147_c0_seq1/g.6897 comp12147_c0_seq1/m.6897 type:complete len:322 (-) comp12147_c0_seq1:360-1325(-)
MSGNKVAIVGSGLIGRCWASLFSRAGFQVVLYDINTAQLDAALEGIKGQLEELSSHGLLRDQDPSEVHKRVTATNVLKDALCGAIHIQECVPENLELKRKVFAAVDACMDAGSVLASSTSCLVPSSFTETLKNRSRCIVAHPVNPPHYIPVVELVPAPWTDPEVVTRTRQLMVEIGQAPVCLTKEVDGFIVNRLQYAMLMEAYRLVEDGLASAEDVDTAISQGLGLRWSFMGPFETIDLNAPNGAQDYFERYSEGIYRVCCEQTEARRMDGTGAAAINTALRSRWPVDQLAQRRQWRDNRLAALAVHKHHQDMADKEKKQE